MEPSDLTLESHKTNGFFISIMRVDLKAKNKIIFIKHFIAGLGWMTGATIGFALFITFLSLVFKWLGGLPVIGNFFANLIQVTNQALEAKRGLPR